MSNDIVLTKYLTLSYLKESFAQELFELTDSNRNYLKQWLPWLDYTNDVDDTLNYIKSAIAQNQKYLGPIFAILSSNQIIGVVGFHTIDRANNIGEIGYWLTERMQGKGFITKSVEKLIKIGFEELALNRIQIPVAENNIKSRAIPERLGFKFEGIIRERELLYGNYVNHAMYSKIKGDHHA